MTALMLLALMQGDITHPKSVEVTGVKIRTTIVDDVAVTDVEVGVRNWLMVGRQADLTFQFPEGAIVVDLDSEGPLEFDIKTTHPQDGVHEEYDRLKTAARRIDPEKLRGPRHFGVGIAIAAKRPDPQLLEKTGPCTYRLRIYPLPPASESVHITETVENGTGILIDTKVDDRVRTPGATQTSTIRFVHRVERDGARRTLDFPFNVRGTQRPLAGSTDAEMVVEIDGRPESIRRRGGDVTVDGAVVRTTLRDADAPLRLTWEDRTVATGGAREPQEYVAVVDDDTALLLVHSDLYRELGEEP